MMYIKTEYFSSGTGTDGSNFTEFNYPGTYQAQDFHYCGLEPDNNIVNYDNAVEVHTCQLLGLLDTAALCNGGNFKQPCDRH